DFEEAFVGCGSGADVTRLLRNVRFSPQSGQTADVLADLLALFRPGDRRPCHSPAEQCDELASPHAGHRASSRPGAAGLPHAQPAAERSASPWARPEMF